MAGSSRHAPRAAFLQGCRGDALGQEVIPAASPPRAREPPAEAQGPAAPSPWFDEAADVPRFVPGAIACLLLRTESQGLGQNEPPRHSPLRLEASKKEARGGEGALPRPHGSGVPGRTSASYLAPGLLCGFFFSGMFRCSLLDFILKRVP